MIGTYINYYFHCHRQLWLFARNINMEHTSEDVFMGKLISQTTYSREEHEIHIELDDNYIAIDFYDKKRKVLHEVKKSNKMQELHIWQVLYYLYVLKNTNIDVKYAEIDYPKLKRIIKVELNNEDKQKLEKTINEIRSIINSAIPPAVINKPYCKKCSYYEFCYC